MAPYFSAEGMLARAALETAVPESGYAWLNARICDHESDLKSDKITSKVLLRLLVGVLGL